MLRLPWSRVSREEGDAGGSILFAIGQGLAKVGEGSIADEAHANAANKIVRRCLDKRAITYRDYKTWRKLNPLIFTTVVDDINQLIGFFDIFPLKTSAGEAIIEGRLTERTLTSEHLVPFEKTASVTHLHIATILLNPRQRVLSPIVAKEVLLLKMREFLERHYAPIETRTYTAFAQTRAGEALLKRSGFTMAVLANENEQRSPLYVLRPSETATAIFRFDRADECFSRDAMLKRLDSRMARIEVQLRILITNLIDRDVRQLPPHVNQKLDERLRDEVRKSAAFDVAPYKMLPARLEFCDFRELQDTMLSKLLWPKFQERFTNKETLTAKFDQLISLRNAIRHIRSVDEITQKEGEAGIIWFERILARQSLHSPGNPIS